MCAFARYPRPDPEYQEFIDEQLQVAKNRILSFPHVNKLFNNFARAENISYTKSKNKILNLCMQKPTTIPKNMIDPEDNTGEVIHIKEDEIGYPDQVILLEDALSSFQIDAWDNHQYRSFKERITSNDYFTSNSAFIEIIIAYRFSKKFGISNITYEPPISTGKNSDILLNFNGKKIYLELTSLNRSEPTRIIDSIFEHIANYLGNKIPQEKPTCFHIWIDTTKLIRNGKNIDDSKSKEKMSTWIDMLHLDELAGSKGHLHFDDLRYDAGISAFLNKKLSDYPYPRNNMRKLFEEYENIERWAKNVVISDIIDSPFTDITLENRESFSSVDVREAVLHTTNERLSQSELFSSIKTAKLQEQSFLNQIERKIQFKINEEQYELDCPIVFMIRASLWSNMFETDPNDFAKIKTKIQNTITKTPHLSGILLYDSDYSNGKFIQNINANENIELSEGEINQLFFT